MMTNETALQTNPDVQKEMRKILSNFGLMTHDFYISKGDSND